MVLIPAVVAAALSLAPQARAQQTSKGGAVFSPEEWEAAASDPKQFMIDAASVQIVKLDAAGVGINDPAPAPRPSSGPDLPKPPAPPSGPSLPPSLPSLPGGGVDPITEIDRIVNLAKKIFDIIAENKPVVDISTMYANAVPDGITHWDQLGGWSQPATTTYAFEAKNMYGGKMVSCKFQVIRQYDGNYKGKGKFLTSVTVQPLDVQVGWGYKFGLKFEAPTVSNVGTTEDPVASMIAKLTWSIDTVLKHEDGTSLYYLQGDGAYREIGGPFSTQARADTREKLQALSASLAPSMPATAGGEAARAATSAAWQ